jgi:cytochrome c
MDGFEINKILGALLGTALLIIAIGDVSGAIYHVAPLKQDAYPVEVPKEAANGAAAAAPKPVDLGTVLAAADVSRGSEIAHNVCTSCHSLDKGQPDATGPNLYGVVGGPVIKSPTFNYSSAMKKFGGDWTFDRLWHFLAGPRDFLPGTAMTFIGLPKEKERADVIAWLRTNADNPVPLPAPAPAQAAAAAPAGQAPAADGQAEAKPGEAKIAPAEPSKSAPKP